jgi:hypothetical protein
MEAGMRAFVSYIRAYKEHHCKFIFRMQVRLLALRHFLVAKIAGVFSACCHSEMHVLCGADILPSRAE